MRAATQKRLRELHNRFGVFFAPGIIFYALSGIFQTLGLHESGPDRQAISPIVGVFASVHKDAVTELPKKHHRTELNAEARDQSGPEQAKHDEEKEGFAPFKLYAVLLSLTLMASALTGIAVALANNAARRRIWGLLAAGCLVPLVLLAL